MNEMMERVARAMHDGWRSEHPEWRQWEALSEDVIGAYIRTARSAIAAMREPTEAMRDAGFDAWDDQANSERVLSAWHSMIDAALAD